MKPDQIALCSTCGETGKCRRRGSGGMELFLWICFLWPIAVIYSIWRSSGAVCTTCGSQALLPVTSPLAAQIVERSPEAGHQMQEFILEAKAKKEKQVASDAFIWRLVLWFCGILVVGGVSQIFISEQAFQIMMPILLVGFFGYLALKPKRSEILVADDERKTLE